MVDTGDLKSPGLTAVRVRAPFRVSKSQNLIQSGSDFFYYYTIRNYKTFSVTLLNTEALK